MLAMQAPYVPFGELLAAAQGALLALAAAAQDAGLPLVATHLFRQRARLGTTKGAQKARRMVSAAGDAGLAESLQFEVAVTLAILDTLIERLGVMS